MEEILVTKDSARKLRLLGHNEWCDCYYHTDNDDEYDYEMGNNQIRNDTFKDYHERIAAPYVSEALLWLMQEKNVGLEVKLDKEHRKYHVTLIIGSHRYTSSYYKLDYQEALKEVIDELLFKENFGR